MNVSIILVWRRFHSELQDRSGSSDSVSIVHEAKLKIVSALGFGDRVSPFL